MPSSHNNFVVFYEVQVFKMVSSVKKEIYAIVIFVLFSAFFCFFSIGKSCFFLDGDQCAIASLVYRNVYPYIFERDPIIPNERTFYIKPHVYALRLLMAATGNFSMSLRILLFGIILPTMIATHYMLREFFPRQKHAMIILATFLMTFTYVKLPMIEDMGFNGMREASARSIFFIFTPLLALFYFKAKNLKIKGIRVSPILILCLLIGILSNIHVSSGIMLLGVFLTHWLLFRRFSLKLAVCILLLLFVLVQIIALQRIDEPIVSFLLSFSNIQIASLWVFDWRSSWLFQFTYLPYIMTALILLFNIDKALENEDDQKLFVFLRRMFFIALFLHFFFGFIGSYFVSYPQLYIAQIFMRGTRTVFYFLELLMLFYLFNGKALVGSRLLHIFSSIAILFAFFVMSSCKLELRNAYFLSFFEMDSFKLNIILRLICFGSLLVLLVLRCVCHKPWLKKGIVWHCIAMLFIWPVLCSAVKIKVGHLLDSTASLGSWAIFESNSNVRLEEFEKVSTWIKSNVDDEALFFQLMRNSEGHKLKISMIRSGFGDPMEIGLESNGGNIKGVLKEMYAKNTKERENNFEEDIYEITKEYGCNYIIVDKSIYGQIISYLEFEYKKIYESKIYAIYLVLPYAMSGIIPTRKSESFDELIKREFIKSTCPFPEKRDILNFTKKCY